MATVIGKSPATVNNVLTVLSKLLKVAVDWGVIDRLPCTVRLLKVPKGNTAFYNFSEFERLVEASRGDNREHLVVLMGGDAGLRAGEMRALRWSDWTFTPIASASHVATGGPDFSTEGQRRAVRAHDDAA